MTWLAWRQSRTSMAIVAGAVAVAALALVVTRPGLIDIYRATGLDDCGTSCVDQASSFLIRARAGAAGPLYWTGFAAVYLIPAVIGIFWGAPMVARELESGTFRLVWSQSTTRSRWLAVKLAGGAAAAMAAAGLLSLAVTWWSAPFDRAYDNRLVAEVFGARGVVPLAYAALAFVLGVFIGTVLRRTVPAMALTLVLVAAVQVVMPTMVRPHLIPPETFTGAVTAEGGFREMQMSMDDGFMSVV
ncbi:ABC transporter permease subunit, partial [Actinoplanes sp. NPDC051633]|uniref:ABC transporter permease subunit n=1 Tax=Actinoplanes sp. NPDC051633 TaxID=3155670 RepID=UPI00342719B3